MFWQKTLRYENGNLFNKDGSNYAGKTKGYLKKTVNALNEIRQGGDTGNKLISDLQASSKNVTIENTEPDHQDNSYVMNNTTDAGNGKGSDGTIYWNSSSSQSGTDTRGNTTRPSFIGLAHELAHGLDAADGAMSDKGLWFTFIDVNGVPHKVYNPEMWATHVENMIRGENGIPLRKMYQPGVQPSTILVPGTHNSIYFNNSNYNGNLLTPIPSQNVQ